MLYFINTLFHFVIFENIYFIIIIFIVIKVILANSKSLLNMHVLIILQNRSQNTNFIGCEDATIIISHVNKMLHNNNDSNPIKGASLT